MKANYFKKIYLFIFLGLILGLAPLSKAVADGLSAPQLPIEVASKQLIVQLEDKAFITNFNRVNNFVETLVDPFIDFNRVSALVLGKLWRKATIDEKQRFKQEFHTLLVRTYSRAFFEFKDWSVRFLPLRMADGAKKVIVKTEILQPSKPALSINYRMILKKGKWKAYDIMIEGVSLVTNYRKSIKNAYKKKGSLNAVIEQLSERNSAAQLRNKS